MATLLMLSGGADSAAVLIKLLTDSDQDVFAHHIVIRDAESETRFRAENIACDKVVEYCKETYRNFVYSKSLWDFQLPYFGWNHTLCAFVGARVIRSFPKARIRYYATGVVDTVPRPAEWELRVEEMRDTFYAALRTAKYKVQPEIIWPVAHMSKQDIYDFLPQELLDVVTVCRDPEDIGDDKFKPCRECTSCKNWQEVGGFSHDD